VRARFALLFALAAGLGLAACAEVGRPPGGPIDRKPPALTQVEPESLATSVDPEAALRFTFDEKLDRRSAKRALVTIPEIQGLTSSLDELTLQFETERGWPPDTVVVWTLTTSLTDRHRVPLEREIRGAFTTAPDFPPGAIQGRARVPEPDTTATDPRQRRAATAETDWTTLRAVLEIPPAEGERRATTWRISDGDAEGRFELKWLDVPSGPFDLAVFLDANANGRRDEREPVATLDSLVLSETDTLLTLDTEDLLLIDLEGPVPIRVALDSVVVDSVAVVTWFEVDGERRIRTVPTDTLGIATTTATPGPLVWGAWVDLDGDGNFGPADSLGTSEPFAAPDTLEVFPATPESLSLAWPDSVLPFGAVDTLLVTPVPRDLVKSPPDLDSVPE